ncbi:TVP38/TMEM64 family protein [Bacillus massiliigorillae]|uniref:TVP38/TMEM64 family protein n=1 Tax=Bacillus massiliigorillae TaxID=1243664 RepID=UPI00039A6B33|nr:TVP38/TMEM64 family protein [Bacillus massiliigorillae]
MFHELQQILSLDNLQILIDTYGKLGPLSGMILPFTEAFLPFLPLTAFMMANAAAYGLVGGFVLSYIGCVAGAWVLYWVFRYFGDKPFFKKYCEHENVKRYGTWLNNKGLWIVTILCMIPVFPNFIITVVAGLNKMSFKMFALASSIGIFGLTLIFSFIGDDILEIATNPSKIILMIVVLITISGIGKLVERNLIISN